VQDVTFACPEAELAAAEARLRGALCQLAAQYERLITEDDRALLEIRGRIRHRERARPRLRAAGLAAVIMTAVLIALGLGTAAVAFRAPARSMTGIAHHGQHRSAPERTAPYRMP